MNDNEITQMAVSNAMTEKPIVLKVKKQIFKIQPPTFGKMQVLSKYYLALDIDEEQLNKEPQVEAMRVCENNTDIVCSLISAATFDSKEDLLNDAKIEERAQFFKWNGKPSDFATIILAIITQVHYENFISSIRLAATLRQNEPNGTN